MRDVIVAGNWKMHTTPADAGELARTIASRTREAGVIRVLCPPFVCLAAVRDALADSDPDVAVGAQNVHHELAGAYTGEIAAPMLQGLATWVIVGHSERRRDAGETDEQIGRKLGRAVEAGLRPILCVGEQLADREAGRAADVVDAQLIGRAGRPRAATPSRRPAWSSRTSRSGRSARAATRRVPTRPRWPTGSAARSGLSAWGALANDVPVLYGGSVTSANIGEFFAEPAIDGALVGGASLKPDEMAGIVARAGLTARARGSRRVTEARPTRPRPIVLVVLDGFGIGRDPSPMPIAAAPMPTWRGLLERWPHARLGASEGDVGLPPGQMGNSEVGPPEPRGGPPGPPGPAAHRRGDRGRELLRAPGVPRSHAPAPVERRGSLARRQPDRAGRRPRQRPASRGPRRAGAPRAGAGRPRPRPARRARHAAGVGARLRRRPGDPPGGGPPRRRDRERRRPLLRDGPRQRWDRTERGYDAIVHGEAGFRAPSATEAIEAAYARGETDEFVAPTVIDGFEQRPRRRRPDHPRELPRRPGATAHPRARRRPLLRRVRPSVADRPPGPG